MAELSGVMTAADIVAAGGDTVARSQELFDVRARSRGIFADEQFLSDTFDRADTLAPYLGPPTSPRRTIRSAYNLYGSGMGAVSGGQIVDGRYTADAGKIVYAVQRLTTPVRRARAIVSFAAGSGDAEFGSATLLISPGPGIIDNAVHLVMTRNAVKIEKIVNSVITSVGGSFSFTGPSYLPKDGTPYAFAFDLNEDGSWIVEYAGRTATGITPEFLDLAGEYVTAEIFHSSTPNMESLARFESIDFGPAGSPLDLFGKNIIPNSNFQDDALWTKGANWSISPGGTGIAVKVIGAASSLTCNPAIPAKPGRKYMVNHTLLSVTGGQLTPSFGGVQLTPRTAAGTYSDTIVAVSPATLSFAANTTFVGYIDNVCVVPVD